MRCLRNRVLLPKQRLGFLSVYNFQFPYPWKLCSVISWFPRINLFVATYLPIRFLETAHMSQWKWNVKLNFYKNEEVVHTRYSLKAPCFCGRSSQVGKYRMSTNGRLDNRGRLVHSVYTLLKFKTFHWNPQITFICKWADILLTDIHVILISQ
jgi:hypothetical protein